MENSQSEPMCPMAVFLRGDTVLLGLRHYEDGAFWTVPGGRAVAKEHIEEALFREVAEETGIDDFEIVTFMGFAENTKNGDIAPHFICRTDKEPEIKEPDKFSEWGWFSKENFPEPFINERSKQFILQLLDSELEE